MVAGCEVWVIEPELKCLRWDPWEFSVGCVTILSDPLGFSAELEFSGLETSVGDWEAEVLLSWLIPSTLSGGEGFVDLLVSVNCLESRKL